MSKLKYYDGTEWKTVNGQITGDTLPIGAIIPYGSTNAPANWLVCDGSAVSRTTYADLFNVIGTSFGSGDGSTTFNLPNLKGKVPVGQDTNDTDFDTIGKTGGSKYLQEHSHSTPSTMFTGAGELGYSEIRTEITVNGTIDKQKTLSTATAGTGDSGNLQPYQVVCYIIKVSQSSGLIANVSNTKSNSQTDTYSCDYINDKPNNKTILYEDASGSNQTITLDDSVSNYDHFVIVYRNTDWDEIFTYVKYDNGSATTITGSHVSSPDRDIYTFNLTMSGTTITWGTSIFSSNNGTPFVYNPFKIIKVIGYK